MKKIALALLAVTFTASVAQAQIVSSKNSHITINEQVSVKENPNYNRIYAGYASSKAKIKYNGESNKGDAIHGFNIGWTGGYNVTKGKLPLYLETGLNFAMFFSSDYGGAGNWNLLGGEIPLSVTYRYQIPHTKIRVAPYFGFHFKAQKQYNNDNHNICGAGMQLGVNFDINHFYLGAGWDKDLTAFQSEGDVKTTLQGARINIGVTF